MNNETRETIRHAVAESLDYGFSDAVFELADHVADCIADGIVDDYEIADAFVPVYTSDLVRTWSQLGATGAGEESDIATPTMNAEQLMRWDVYAVALSAAAAGLEAADVDTDDQ